MLQAGNLGLHNHPSIGVRPPAPDGAAGNLKTNSTSER